MAIRILGGKGVGVPSCCACSVDRSDCVAAAKRSGGCDVGVMTAILGVDVGGVADSLGAAVTFVAVTVSVTVVFVAGFTGPVVGVSACCAIIRGG